MVEPHVERLQADDDDDDVDVEEEEETMSNLSQKNFPLPFIFFFAHSALSITMLGEDAHTFIAKTCTQKEATEWLIFCGHLHSSRSILGSSWKTWGN